MTVRVLILFTAAEIGGAERSLSRMASHRGAIDYDVATLAGEGPFTAWARSLGLEPHAFGPSTGAGITPGALWRAVRHIRRTRPDIIYVIGIRAAIYMRLLRPLLKGARLVHGIRMNYTPDRPEFLPMRFGDGLLGGLTEGWIANSSAAAETLVTELGVDPAKVAVVFNGIDLPEPGLPPSARPPVVLTVANLAPRKGHVAYLDAVERILADVPDARFVFAGRDDMNGAVQAAIAERGLSGSVSCLGYCSDTDALMREARVFVLPSFREGMPTAILEAMAHGLPVVAFPIDGIVDQVIDGETGRLAPTGDQAALAAAVTGYLTDPGAADAAGRAARLRVAEVFTRDAMRDRHAALWQAMMAGRSIGPVSRATADAPLAPPSPTV